MLSEEADRRMTSLPITYSIACDNTGIAREENRLVEPLGPLVKRTFGVTNRCNMSQICHESAWSEEALEELSHLERREVNDIAWLSSAGQRKRTINQKKEGTVNIQLFLVEGH